MDIYETFGLKETLLATWHILRDGAILSIAMILNFIPTLLVSIFSGHLDGITYFDTASLYLFIDATLGYGCFPYAIGPVSFCNCPPFYNFSKIFHIRTLRYSSFNKMVSY